MIEIESNKSIKGIKQEYIFTMGLVEIIKGILIIAAGICTYMLCFFLPEIIRGDICMFVVLGLMFLTTYRINNQPLLKIALYFMRNLLYMGKPIKYSNRVIKESKNGNRKIIRKTGCD